MCDPHPQLDMLSEAVASDPGHATDTIAVTYTIWEHGSSGPVCAQFSGTLGAAGVGQMIADVAAVVLPGRPLVVDLNRVQASEPVIWEVLGRLSELPRSRGVELAVLADDNPVVSQLARAMAPGDGPPVYDSAGTLRFPLDTLPAGGR